MKYFIIISTIMEVVFLVITPKHIGNSHYRTGSNYIMQDSVVVNLEKTSFKDMPVLFIKDTALSTEKIKDALSKDYDELMQYILDNELQPQKFMAWYYSIQPPWLMDVAIQTTNIPEKLSGRIQSRIQKGGEVIIAHIWGPYDQVGRGYVKIKTWLKENKRQAKGNPFEIYINDPSSVKNPSEIQTDVYQPIE